MTSDIPFAPHPFWDFSLAVYGTEGVAPACLDLQDRRGVDVNLLLFCLWAGSERGLAYEAGGFADILAAAGDWQHTVIHPMRAVRRRLKSGSPHLEAESAQALRGAVLETEIACEHAEQLIIVAAADTVSHAARKTDRAAAVAANLAAYASGAGIGLDTSDAASLKTVLAARLEPGETDAVLKAVLASD